MSPVPGSLFRRILFWAHLSCGVSAGLIILLMSVTGVLLTYEHQMVERAARSARPAPLANAASWIRTVNSAIARAAGASCRTATTESATAGRPTVTAVAEPASDVRTAGCA